MERRVEPAREIETGTELVLAEVGADGVGVLTLNRAERRNALAPAMYPGMHAALDAFAADPEVGCVMVTGAGGAFCAGGDVRDGAARRSERRPTFEERVDELTDWAAIVPRLAAHPQVVIGALPGPAVGAGLSLALACDMRIAAASAKLIPGWGRLALSGDLGGPWLITRLLGPARALEWLVDGRPGRLGGARGRTRQPCQRRRELRSRCPCMGGGRCVGADDDLAPRQGERPGGIAPGPRSRDAPRDCQHGAQLDDAAARGGGAGVAGEARPRRFGTRGAPQMNGMGPEYERSL